MKKTLIALSIGWLVFPAVADEPAREAASGSAAKTSSATAPATADAKAPAAAAGTAELSSEQAAVKKLMEELFDASKKVNGAEKGSARQRIEAALDWERVARECLGTENWKKHAGSNREQFRSLLKDVIVRTAYSRMDKFWENTTYVFEKIDVKGNEAFVRAKFTVSGESVPLDYYLSRKGAKWLIHDIAFEDLRYSTNINEQITAFLKEKGFPQLLSNLKKRRDELANPTKKS